MKQLVIKPILNGFLVTPEKKEGECGDDVTSYCTDLISVLRTVYVELAEYEIAAEPESDTLEGFVHPPAKQEPDSGITITGPSAEDEAGGR